MHQNSINTIKNYYEKHLDQFKEGHLAVAWPNEIDTEVRNCVMLEIIQFDRKAIQNENTTILDFGCGLANLYDHIKKNGKKLKYIGLDISQKYIEICRERNPEIEFIVLDVVNSKKTDNVLSDIKFDYAIINGVFTVKDTLTEEDAFKLIEQIIEKLWPYTQRGIALNVMSKIVDWERSDLNHISFDKIADFIKKITRNFIIRHDYELYEYTIYMYKN